MNFESKLKHDSVSYPGVSFAIKNPKASRRGKLRLMLSGQSYEISQVIGELATLRQAKKDGQEVDGKRVADLLQDFERINDEHIKPAKVRWMLKSISGLEIDGKPATVESLIEDGPEDLYDEIFDVIEKASGLSEEEAGESEPASTSGGREAGEILSINAPSVESLEHSPIAIAAV